MSGLLNSLHTFYDGLGVHEYTNSLPLQTLPDSKKNDAWKENVMDRLEQIGLSQLRNNLEFREYYKMLEGRLVHTDFQAPPDIVRDIKELRDEINLPTYLRHYDIIGIVTNQLTGEYDKIKDKIRVDSIDEYSENEFIREQTRRLKDFTVETFNLELQRALLERGINPTKTDFKSDEERQAYAEYIEQQRNEIINPKDIERDMSKNWKVKAVEWAEKTIEADTQRFFLDDMDRQEMTDYLLTGRFFRHYHIGYDYYKPETWSPINTFFSQDLDIENPQDGEYVGRVHFLSVSDIIQRYGDKLSSKLQEQLSTVYDYGTQTASRNTNYNLSNIKGRPVGEVLAPFDGYFDYDITLQLQDAFDKPLGETTFVDDKGEQKTVPRWLPDMRQDNFYGTSQYARYMRDDINVRTDLLRVTEAYWRGWQRIAILNYETPEGYTATEIVTDDLMNDFLLENGIKKLKNVTLEEIENDPQPNTIAYFYIPQIWKGKKISAGSFIKGKDIYFDIEPLEFQIKGDSNIFDMKLPVAGIIGNSTARKIRPYQLGYNICLNQVFNLLEKEIGMFFLFDINFLPSEFKEMGDSRSILEDLRGFARDVGFIPTDTSKQNMAGRDKNSMNTFIKQDLSYGEQIQRRLVLAQQYKLWALEQIGINPGRMGQVDGQETAEGIKQEVNASYSQTEVIFQKMNAARRKALELHLTVAQYSQKNEKDISVFYRRSDGDLISMRFSDDDFHLRKLGILPVSNSKARKELEQLKQVLLNNNTMGSDMLDYAELFSADSMVELVSIGRRNRMLKEKETQQERAHEQQLLDKTLQKQLQDKQADRVFEASENEKDRQARLKAEQIEALGKATDDNASAQQLQQLNKNAELIIRQEGQENDRDLKQQQIDLQKNNSNREFTFKEEELRLKIKALKQKERDRATARHIATVNNN